MFKNLILLKEVLGLENTIESTAATTERAVKRTKNLEAVYIASQLVEGYRTFGTSRAIVACALKMQKRDAFTMREARRIIDEFKNRR